MKVISAETDAGELEQLLGVAFDRYNNATLELCVKYMKCRGLATILTALITIGCSVSLLRLVDDYLNPVGVLVVATLCVVTVFNSVNKVLWCVLTPMRGDVEEKIAYNLCLVYDVRFAWEAEKFVESGELQSVQYETGSRDVCLMVAVSDGVKKHLCRLPEEMLTKYEEEGVLDFTWIDKKVKELKELQYGD